MLTKGMSRSEIEKELNGKGDFIQIDYLNRFIAQKPPLHEKKFAFMKLIEIYESKKMFNDVAKMYSNLVLLALSSQEKIDYMIKETKSYIQGGRFDEADAVMRRAMDEVPIVKKADIFEDIKRFYKQQAETYERENRRNNAVKVYEKLLSMKITEQEKSEVKAKLLSLYDQLGKFRESSVLDKKR
ncbi:MAG: tetratricopeptide repeat protein [Nanobdellota archaeon]